MATSVAVPAIQPDLDVHYDPDIKNPSVPIRWCWSESAYQHIIDGLANGFGYALLLVATKNGDTENFHEIREIHDPLQPFTLVTFTKPQDWSLHLALFERKAPSKSGESTSDALKRSVEFNILDKEKKPSRFKRRLPDLSQINVTSEVYHPDQLVVESRSENRSMGVAIAACTISVDVPKKVFANPPPEAISAYCNYFFKMAPTDQCELRRRFFYMVPGFVPWILLEFLKRLFVFVVGLLACFVCVAKGSFGLMGRAFEPAINFELGDGVDVKDKMWPFDTKIGKHFTPWRDFWYGVCGVLAYFVIKYILPPVVHFCVWAAKGTWKTLSSWIWHLLHTPHKIGPRHHGHGLPWWVYVLAVVAVVMVMCFSRRGRKVLAELLAYVFSPVMAFPEAFELFGDAYADWYEQPRRVKRRAQQEQQRLAEERRLRLEATAEGERLAKARAQLAAERAARLAPALVCGAEPAKVSLNAIPKEARTLSMFWRSLKSDHCRPYG